MNGPRLGFKMGPWLLLGIVYKLISHVSSADPAIKIPQTYPATRKVNGYNTITVEKDSDCLIACVVSRRPSNRRTQWYFQKQDLNKVIPIATDTDTQNPFKYQIDKPANNNWRLKIRNVQESDQGTYICRIQLNGFQSIQGVRVIRVVQTPRISDIYTSSDTLVEEGEKAELRCDATGIPTPTISWQLVSGGILPTGGREFDGPSIVISSASREHRGLYKCVAYNIAGRDERHVRLVVKFPPRVTSGPREIYQTVGHSVHLRCEVFGNPVPMSTQIVWSKDGKILEDQNRYIQDIYRGSTSVLVKLTIKYVNENDYGSYRCYAENSEGFGQTMLELKLNRGGWSTLQWIPGISLTSSTTTSFSSLQLLPRITKPSPELKCSNIPVQGYLAMSTSSTLVLDIKYVLVFSFCFYFTRLC